MKITLGEKEYDLAGALPVTLGDIRRLKRVHGIQLSDLASMDLDIVAKVFLMLCQKIDSAITEEMVDAIPLTMMDEVSKFLSKAAVPDRPTLG